MKVDPNKSMFAGEKGVRENFGVPKEHCGCYSCLGQITQDNGFPLTMSVLIVCDICGNKRCPRATFHENECTNSNELYQKGSRYGGIK